MDVIERLAHNAVASRYETLPKETVEITKLSILEILGVLVAGATAPGCEAIVNLVKYWGGREESTILVHGGRVPAHNAALANSVMARALDFDDGMDKGMHIISSAVPTALAVAEMRGGVRGRELITAIATGTDLAVRLNLATDYHLGHDPTGVCMVFGTAAIAGKLLELDDDGMLNALGIALNRAGGTLQSNIDGALAVRLVQGLTSRAGIECALLAQGGITGVRNVIEGLYGYFHLYARDKGNLAPLTQELGKRFEGAGHIMHKKYPSCGGTLAATEGALELAKEHNLKAEDIDGITVRVTQRIYNLVGHPFVVGDNPVVDAQFSIAYTVANAIIRRDSRLEHFTEESIKDPQVVALAERVHPVVDGRVGEMGIPQSAIVEVNLKDGRKLEKFIKEPKGFPGNPMSTEEIKSKFSSCMAVASKPLAAGAAEELADLIAHLEDVDDVSRIVQVIRVAAPV